MYKLNFTVKAPLKALNAPLKKKPRGHLRLLIGNWYSILELDKLAFK